MSTRTAFDSSGYVIPDTQYQSVRATRPNIPLPQAPNVYSAATYTGYEEPIDKTITEKVEKGRSSIPWKWVAIYIALTIIIAMSTFQCISLAQMSTDNANGKSTLQQSASAKSCLELNGEGLTTDGLYQITPIERLSSTEVYCDMTTDGGGWTLVASVNEDDIKRKCDFADQWSTYLTRDRAHTAGIGNWENQLTFGNAREANDKDYKSTGFYSLNASDIMIWHVRQSIGIESFKERASLRYRTSNGFLKNHRGNLPGLFREYPIYLATESEYIVERTQRISKVLNAFVKKSFSIRSRITGWYNYTTADHYHITDTNLYNEQGGNGINAGAKNCTDGPGIVYNVPKLCRQATFDSRRTHPIFAAAVITNHDMTSAEFAFYVFSYRPTTSDVTTYYDDVMTNGNFQLQFYTIQYSDSKNPTECRLHFMITNAKEWESIEPRSFFHEWNGDENELKRNTFTANGEPSNILLGYTLLLRENGSIIPRNEIRAVVSDILNAISTIPDLFYTVPDFSVPVVFDEGTTSDVMDAVPTLLRPFVQPGFIQFRSYSALGNPNAICPGVRFNKSFSQYLCVGGISDDVQNLGTCGDFAGWEGNSQQVGTAHSSNDIYSTIYIFYRIFPVQAFILLLISKRKFPKLYTAGRLTQGIFSTLYR